MRKIRTAVLAGLAAIAAAGTAQAMSQGGHVMTISVPHGPVGRIEYEGSVVPNVMVAHSSSRVPIAWFTKFQPAPFALFDRIAVDMALQSELMMRRVRALALPVFDTVGTVHLTDSRNRPPGTIRYSFVSTTNGVRTCSRSVQITSLGSGQQPRIISTSPGDCPETPSAIVTHPDPADGMRRT